MSSSRVKPRSSVHLHSSSISALSLVSTQVFYLFFEQCSPQSGCILTQPISLRTPKFAIIFYLFYLLFLHNTRNPVYFNAAAVGASKNKKQLFFICRIPPFSSVLRDVQGSDDAIFRPSPVACHQTFGFQTQEPGYKLEVFVHA